MLSESFLSHVHSKDTTLQQRRKAAPPALLSAAPRQAPMGVMWRVYFHPGVRKRALDAGDFTVKWMDRRELEGNGGGPGGRNTALKVARKTHRAACQAQPLQVLGAGNAESDALRTDT